MASLHIDHESLADVLQAIALSTARVRRMADEAHALVERLERPAMMTRVKGWSAGVIEPAPPARKKG